MTSSYPGGAGYETVAGRAAASRLGACGAMLSGSKTNPAGDEAHTIYWNACVFDREGTQIWHGDLDLTSGEAQLRALASDVGPLYVTPELPWRAEGFESTMRDRYERSYAIRFEPLDNGSG